MNNLNLNVKESHRKWQMQTTVLSHTKSNDKFRDSETGQKQNKNLSIKTKKKDIFPKDYTYRNIPMNMYFKTYLGRLKNKSMLIKSL